MRLLLVCSSVHSSINAWLDIRPPQCFGTMRRRLRTFERARVHQGGGAIAGWWRDDDRLERPTVVDARHALWFVRQQRLDPAPLEVGQIVSAYAKAESGCGVVWKPLVAPLPTGRHVLDAGAD